MIIPFTTPWYISRLAHPNVANRLSAIRKIVHSGRVELRGHLTARLADQEKIIRTEAHKGLLELHATELDMLTAYAAAFKQGVGDSRKEAFDSLRTYLLHDEGRLPLVDRMAEIVSSKSVYFGDADYDALAETVSDGTYAERFLLSLLGKCRAYKPDAHFEESIDVQRLARQVVYASCRNDPSSLEFFAAYSQELFASRITACRILSLEILTILLEREAVSAAQAVKVLTKALDDADHRVRLMAIFSLGYSNDRCARRQLLELYLCKRRDGHNYATMREKAEIIEALARLGAPEVVEIIADILRHFGSQNPSIRESNREDHQEATAAVHAIQIMRLPRRELLTSILDRYNSFFRGDPLNRGWEVRHIWRASFWFLEATVEALGNFRDAEMIPLLVRRMADSRKLAHTPNAAARELAIMGALSVDLQRRHGVTPWGQQWDYDDSMPDIETRKGRKELYHVGQREIVQMNLLLDEPLWSYRTLNVEWPSYHLPRWHFRMRSDNRIRNEKSRWIGFGRLEFVSGADASMPAWEYTLSGIRIANRISDLVVVNERIKE